MKKYLMTGVAALAICAAFTSCSKNEELYDPEQITKNEVAQVYENYNRAFIATFGQPAANHKWGFINYSQAGTRATGDFANYVGAYPDANMWTSKGFLAPDPLTHAQKLRAQYYFQMTYITNPNQPDNGIKDFFMQQVYDGGTDPMDGKSPEVYNAADGNTKINSGEHMDHLTCGPDHTHTYNFNNGNCSTNGNVANRDQTDVNNTAQQHSDEIQLLLNTKTSCFGYANSDASFVRDDRWTLVSAATIDNFCDNDPAFANWLNGKLQSGEVDKKCDDEFHRSFIGFDFDMIPDESLYSRDAIGKNGEILYYIPDPSQVDHYVYHYFSISLNGQSKVWNGTALVDATSVGEVIDGNLYPYIPGTTKKVPLTNPNSNQYCGTLDNNWSDDDWKYTENNNGQNTVYANIAKMITALNANKLPKNNKEWITFGNCADGYYSDWIVTFMPADYNPPIPSEWDLRIIAEDLNATAQEGDTEDSDWDFNDVVLDVKFLGSNNVRIRVTAAGATLPIRINGEDALEVHGLYGQATNIMINTGAAAAGYPNQAYENKYPAAATFERNISGVDAEYGANIKIEVKKTVNGEETWIELEAKPGQPASKMGVTPDYNYCSERQDIKGLYSGFVAWVAKQNPVYWWRPVNQ